MTENSSSGGSSMASAPARSDPYFYVNDGDDV